MSARIADYRALAMQLRCQTVNNCADRAAARSQMEKTIARVGEQIAGSKRFLGNDLKLVVLPEYFLTGFPTHETPQQWRDKACLSHDDDLWRQLAQLAIDNQLHLSGNAYEIDRFFSELYFQTSFIIDPSGAVALRYRRLISMFAPTPHDVWDQYLEHYGMDEVFPVLDCELGRLACVASEEILYPEISRALAIRGAEVLLHSSSEIGSPQDTTKGIAKRARAVDNQCFVVSANSAGVEGISIPAQSTDGGSQIIDDVGRIRAAAGPGESIVANDVISIQSLRQTRARPGMGNLLSRQRFELFASTYQQSIYPPNSLLRDGAVIEPDKQHFLAIQKRVLQSKN